VSPCDVSPGPTGLERAATPTAQRAWWVNNADSAESAGERARQMGQAALRAALRPGVRRRAPVSAPERGGAIPRDKWRATQEGLADLIVSQQRILASAARARAARAVRARLRRPAQLLREENEAQAEAFLASEPRIFGGACRCGAWGEDDRRDRAGRRALSLRLTPARHGTDGSLSPYSERQTMSDRTCLILDFGSQVTQLIARRVRESGVYCEIHPYTISEARLW